MWQLVPCYHAKVHRRRCGAVFRSSVPLVALKHYVRQCRRRLTYVVPRAKSFGPLTTLHDACGAGKLTRHYRTLNDLYASELKAVPETTCNIVGTFLGTSTRVFATVFEATNVTCRCPLMPVKSRQILGNHTRAGTTTMVVTVVIEAPNVDVRFFFKFSSDLRRFEAFPPLNTQ